MLSLRGAELNDTKKETYVNRSLGDWSGYRVTAGMVSTLPHGD